MNTFRVLVLDDSQELIRKICSRVTQQHNIADTDWQVLFQEVHIQVEKIEGETKFTDETLRAIIEKCRNHPDLIFADYGFIAPQDSSLPPNEYFASALTPADLSPALREYISRKHAQDKLLQKQVKETFLSNSCPFYLYTYTGKNFQGIDPIPEARMRLTHRAFPQSKVRLVDISKELFENDAHPGDDRRFRAYLTAGFLAQVIERELLLHVITHENRRLRFVRFKRSGFGVAVIVLLGGAFGTTSEWLGSRIMALVHQGDTISGLVIGILALVLFFVLGLLLPIIFERILSNPFSHERSNKYVETDNNP